MNVILTGGGTGGHIYPAMAIADKIKEKNPEANILYIGNEEGLETEIVPSYGYPIKLVAARWLEKSPIELVKTGIVTLKGVSQCKRIFKKFKPDIVIGTGGFICFPVMYAGYRYGAKCYLHEQNAYPGMANRALEKFVDKLFLGFAEASPYFRHPHKHVYTGNPVRKSFFNLDKNKSRESLKINQDQFMLVSFGGSWGAEKINEIVVKLVSELKENKKITFVFVTGKIHYEEILEELQKKGIELKGNIILKPYIESMADYIGAADFIISRAGALSVAEATVCGRASLLVPFPGATGNHQYFNAKAVADRGGALLLEEKDLTYDKMKNIIFDFLNHPEKQRQMEEKSKNCSPGDSAEIIYENIFLK